MKARFFKDSRGKALASVLETGESANLVPLDVETEDQGELEMKEVALRTRDLFDIDDLHKRMSK